jgi:leucyl/phenylalanyl-tRNA--protein transferase
MLYLLDPDKPEQGFPDPQLAETEPDGLLAVGGDLTPVRLVTAYRSGIFPWYSEGQPILWWSPDPRTVLLPAAVSVSRSLRRTLRRGRFEVSFNQDFRGVIAGCAAPRRDDAGTWILPEMIEAYETLHSLGYAHSVEVWQDGQLAGGLYGVCGAALGCAFFGESMFSRVSDASKVALVALCRVLAEGGFALIDCQMYSPHLASMGAESVPRQDFLRQLARATTTRCDTPWPTGRRPTPDLANDR